MEEGLKRLDEIMETLQRGTRFCPVTIPEFLSWFGVQRRGAGTVWWIKRNLEGRGLGTEPDFESANIHSPIEFFLTKTATPGTDAMAVGSQAQTSDATNETNFESADPTYRISKLQAANKPPISVSPDADKREAVTLMLTNDVSQLPVMTSAREVKGVISWISIGTRLALGKDGSSVRDLMDIHYEIRADASIFQAIPIIVKQQYVLVRGVDNRISGIVTATDLSLQFQQLAEPFLKLGEIENYIRLILGDNFSIEELASVRDVSDGSKEIKSVADLTYGDYIRLLENDDRFDKIKIPIDRKTFCGQLDKVRRIRNDVMHFDPVGIPSSDLELLRYFARFLRRLKTIGV